MAISYKRFLSSPYWRAVRRRAISLDPRCERCGCPNHLHVHHTRYDKLGTNEEYYELRNLVVLCSTCHAEEHGLPAPERDHSGPETLFDAMKRMGFRDHRVA